MSKTIVFYKSGAKRSYDIVGELDNRFGEKDNIVRVEIGDSVTEIGNWAFYKCSSLTSVTIPNSVTSIGTFAFWYCPCKITTVAN